MAEPARRHTLVGVLERHEIESAVAEVNATLDTTWRVHRSLPGGWQQGAWLLEDDDAKRAVLKVHTDEQERVLEAGPRIEHARRLGWPTPQWLAQGRMSNGAAWVLMAFVAGRRPTSLDERVADEFITAWEIQRGLGKGTAGWGEWATGVVFEDWTGYRQRVTSTFPYGGDVVELVDRIADRFGAAKMTEGDLVHGNFSIVNSVDDGRRIWLVDAATAGSGPVAYDVAEALLTAPAHSASGIDKIWHWVADHIPPTEVAICVGSVALTMADAYRRLRVPGGDVIAPWMLAVLRRALAQPV